MGIFFTSLGKIIEKVNLKNNFYFSLTLLLKWFQCWALDSPKTRKTHVSFLGNERSKWFNPILLRLWKDIVDWWGHYGPPRFFSFGAAKSPKLNLSWLGSGKTLWTGGRGALIPPWFFSFGDTKSPIISIFWKTNTKTGFLGPWKYQKEQTQKLWLQ